MHVFEPLDQAYSGQWWVPLFGLAVMGLMFGLWLYEFR